MVCLLTCHRRSSKHHNNTHISQCPISNQTVPTHSPFTPDNTGICIVTFYDPLYFLHIIFKDKKQYHRSDYQKSIKEAI